MNLRDFLLHGNPLINKARYPHSSIALGVRIRGKSHLARNTRLGLATVVTESSLGDGVVLGRGCQVTRSILEKNISIQNGCSMVDTTIGAYSYMSVGCTFGHTKIGRFCSVGPQVMCGIGEHPVSWLSTSPAFYSLRKQCGVTFARTQHFKELRDICIGHDVWVGARVVIRDGVQIGNGAIIAAGAVVVADVPDYAVVGGVPARVIKYRFSDKEISKFLSLSWWKWSEEQLRAAQSLMIQDNVDRLKEFTLTYRQRPPKQKYGSVFGS